MVLRVSAGRMVGRDDELGRLLALLDDAEAGRSVVALVSGDAGVGKSRLVAEATRLAAGRGFTVLSGQCAELGDSVPYLPLADALRSAAQAGVVRDALSSRPALSMLLPEGGGGLTIDSDRSGLARQQMFGGVLGLLTELAAAGPVLLVLEDLHWADTSTRDLVTFLSRMLHRERVALIGTYRTDDLHRRHPLRPVVAELLRLPGVIAVDLAPLSPSALAEHLTAAAQGRIGATELNDIITRAEGNAYYAEELLAASVSGDRQEQSLPAGLAALLLSRVEQLSDAAQQVLRAAAVAGRKADDELVQAASGLVSTEYEAAVREAVTHQLLVPDGTEGYVFRHALLREAVYGDLLPGERTRLHGTMSALLADEHRLATPGTAAELAQHCLASHDIPGAFAASIRAGEQAENALAAARAADAPWVQADALVTLGFLSNREGRNDEAIKLLTQAHKQARGARVLGVELRAAYHLARAHLEHGDLIAGGAVAHEGTKRANETGLGLAPYGTDVQHLHFQCHYADGKWDHAQEIADGFPVRVTSIPEASCPRWPCSSTSRAATRWWRSGAPGSSRSCRPTGSTGSSRARC